MSRPKIALVGYRLNKGGAERVMANLSNYFHANGIEVHNIIVLDDVEYPHSGEVFNLGKLKNKHNGIFNKIKRLVVLKKYLNKHDFDFIIDFRFRIKPIQELLISKCVYNTETIFTVHSSKIDSYMPNLSPLTRLMYGYAFQNVAITKTMQQLIQNKHHLDNVSTIYNSIDIDDIVIKSQDTIELDFEYIIGVGQYDTNVKQFDKLIEAYAKSKLPKQGIALVILGEGKLKENLKSIAKSFNVESLVHFLGFKNNPFKYIKNAKFFVLSSELEGLPMVLLESLACKTPVVSFNCPTGPEEVISHGENGLLIEHQNIEALTEGINTMMYDSKLYDTCKMNTFITAQKFSIETIGKQWLDLMKYKN